MKRKFTFLLTLCMAFVIQLSFAQEMTVSGTVTSAMDGLTLPGVNVLVKGTTRGTQTDFDGNYSIAVSTGETLVFSYVGLKEVEIVVGSSSTINVSMEEDVSTLEEVVVTGYTSFRRSEVTGSAVQLGNEKISDVAVAPSVDRGDEKV